MAVVDLVQHLHGLAHVCEVGPDERAGVIWRADEVDVGDRVTVLEQLGQARSPELSTAACQYHLCHR
jgi:hypothetical protein